MLNPIIKNRKYLISYSSIWVLIILIQFFFLNYFQDIDLGVAIVDSLVFNILMAIFGFCLWNILRFKLMNQHNFFDQTVNHLLSAIAFITLWISCCYYILTYFEANNADYCAFLLRSLPSRTIVGVFFYLIFILLYYIILYYEDLQKKMHIENELNKLVKEAELNALKAQINPHFLFNSLNSISSLTMTKPDKAQEMVIKLSDFLRYSLSHDKNEKTSLRNEMENIQRYLDIEKTRFGNRLRFESNIQEACLETQIPNMILQPLFENAIKHGVYKSTEEILIELSCVPTESFFEIHILNDFDPEVTRPKGEGIGLKNIKSRMALIYGRSDLVEIHPGKIDFEVVLRIPR